MNSMVSSTQEGVTYYQQVSFCGKTRCRKCRAGIGHGPYWYAYRRKDGRTVRSYVGKALPPQQTTPAGTGPAAQPCDQVAVRVCVLGQYQLDRRVGGAWQPVGAGAWQHQQVRLLLGCLLASPGRVLGREQLIETLWPDLELEQGMARLDRAVHSLRQVLEPHLPRPAESQVLRTSHQQVLLGGQGAVWVDADAFRALLQQAHATAELCARGPLLEQAEALYCGDFLPEAHEAAWAAVPRQALRRSWIGLLLDLADVRSASGDLVDALGLLDRLLAVDPANEAAVQRLLVCLARQGRRGEALAAYERLASLVHARYQSRPLPLTRSLYDAVRQGEEVEASFLPASPPSPAPVALRLPAHIGRRHQSPLVGRVQEREVLHELLQATATPQAQAPQHPAAQRAGQPQLALLCGEPGIGKTRLAEEVAREAQRRGWLVAWGRAYAQESAIPYGPWIEALRQALAQSPVWVHAQELGAHPLVYAPLRLLLPELQEQLPPVLLPATGSLAPEQEQVRLWEAVLQLLTTLAAQQPLLLLLDDLHWADAKSSELLGYLARRLAGHRVLLVGTVRQSELPPTPGLRTLLADLGRAQTAVLLPLERLSDAEIATLLAHLPAAVLSPIQARAAGNPFFAEELARVSPLAELSPAPPAPGRSRSGPATLPQTIAATLDLRLATLSAACRRMLGKAAVLGGSFEVRLLRVLEAGSAGDEEALFDLLEEAVQAGVLTEAGAGRHSSYAFWHPLLVSHLYSGLSLARRELYHRQAAEVLREVYQGREEEGAATITYHLVAGDAEADLVARYAELAGDRAYRLCAYPEAERHYRLAVEHTGALPADASPDESLRLANLLGRLGECTRFQGSYKEARHYFEQALEVYSHHLSSHIDPQYEAQIEALLWCKIGKTWCDTGDYEKAQQCYSHSEQVLREAAVATGPAWASLYLERGYVLWLEGNFEEAHQTALQALAIFENVLDHQDSTIQNAFHSTATRRTLAGDPADLGRTHMLLGCNANAAGQSTIALDHLNKALAIFEQHEHRREIANACGNIGDVYLRKAEHTLAQAAVRRSLNMAEQVGDASIMSVAFCNLGMLSARSGALAEAEAYYKRALALAEQINDPVYRSQFCSYLTPVMQDQGKLNEARVAVHQALKISRAMNNIPCLGFALVALGRLHITKALAGQEKDNDSPGTVKQQGDASSTRLLKLARTALRRALALDGLEAETRTEGQLALAQASFLLGEIDIAWQQAMQAMEEAQRLEQTWLLACARRLMGEMLSAQGQREEARTYFQQALETLQKCDMRLEWARTLQSYGAALLGEYAQDDGSYRQGVQYLEEAREVFRECNAVLHLQRVEWVIDRDAVGAALPRRKGSREGR